MHACSVTQSCPTLCDALDLSPLGSSVLLGFFRQEYWSGLPFPPPGDLPNPGTEPVPPASPALHVDSTVVANSELLFLFPTQLEGEG